jgi:hypothetical protein
MPIIPAFKRTTQEGIFELQASLGCVMTLGLLIYKARSCLKKTKAKQQKRVTK